MDILFQIFIQPFELFLGWILFTSFWMTGNYGVSLLLLSLVLNIVLLPLYVFTERWQEAERKVQGRLQPKLREIRQAFSGKERFAMVHTLYRQVGYHPIYALRSSLRMLIQVPFLIAAYHLLSELEPLEGISFLAFDDLMKPDGLLWGIHLMPLVMTAVSVLSVLFYRPRFSSKEMWQFWCVSALFLVWLYPSPVALVLFWTFNIICSLLVNVVYFWWHPTPTVDTYQGVTTLGPIVEDSHVPKRWENFWKKILGSPYVLGLLVGVYPITFYISNNWFMFNAWSGFLILATFSLIVFFVMSVVYVIFSWVVPRLVVDRASTIIQQLFVLVAILMLGYLLRETFMAMAGQEPIVVMSAIGGVALLVAWFTPRMRIYQINVVLALMCMLHLVNGMYFINSAEGNHLVNSVGYHQQKTLYEQLKFSHTPNVYFIVPDGYPNQEALEKIFDIDNREFYHQLESLGFGIKHSSFSNYRNTTASLSATFGMGHHFYGGSVGSFDLLDSRRFIASPENPVVRIFKNNGYQVNFIHADDYMFTSGCHVDVCSPNVFLGEFINVLIPKSLQSGSWLEDEIDHSYVGSIQRIVKHVQRVSTDQPQFTYVHMMPPGHSPHTTIEPKELAVYREKFRGNVEIANQNIVTLVQSIVSRDPNAILILNADHGAWGLGAYKYVPSEVYDGVSDRLIGLDHLGVLLAIRWPEGGAPVRQDVRTNVNLFRYVFSYLMGKDILLASMADDDGFMTKGFGSEEVLLKVMDNGMVLDNMVELGTLARNEAWSERGVGKRRDPSWHLHTADANEAEILVFPDRPNLKRIEITQADTKETWHIQLSQNPLLVEGNTRYLLRFRARADDVRKMGVAVSQAYAPWSSLSSYRSFVVSKQWQEYEWEFMATADEDNARLYFDLGGWNVPVEIEAVSLQPLSSGTPRWTLNLLGESEARLVRLPEDPERIRVAITSGDMKNPYSIQLTRKGLELMDQERYWIRMDIRADAQRDIYIAVSEAQHPWANLGLYERVSLTSEWQTMEFEFVANNTEHHARLQFDLGGPNIPVDIKGVQFRKNPRRLRLPMEASTPADPGPSVIQDERDSQIVHG